MGECLKQGKTAHKAQGKHAAIQPKSCSWVSPRFLVLIGDPPRFRVALGNNVETL
jgi:hypothetical protein